jgi:HPt (histidine-containing phosphotransfer) domain-containing protein
LVFRDRGKDSIKEERQMAARTNDDHEGKIVVYVDEDLQDLIPGYLENRLKDIAAIHESLARGDYEEIRSLGHKMKGSGGGYGFDEITNIGQAMEQAAKIGNKEEIARQAEALKTYLETVDVVYQA